MNSAFFDSKEVRSSDERENDHLASLKNLIEKAKNVPFHSARLNYEVHTLNDFRKTSIFCKLSRVCTSYFKRAE